jgi:hypothetical protein
MREKKVRQLSAQHDRREKLSRKFIHTMENDILNLKDQERNGTCLALFKSDE